jgi:uroporphyrinogen-III synthase
MSTASSPTRDETGAALDKSNAVADGPAPGKGKKMVGPLAGRRVLVSRARKQASALSSELEALGARVLAIPFIQIRRPRSYRALDAAIRNLSQYDWLILTSANGVQALCERMAKLGMEKSAVGHLKICAIGPATKKAIEANGLTVDVMPKEYVAESVVESLKERVVGQRVLLARAKVARDVIPCELRKIAAMVEVVEAYETIVPESSRTRLIAALNHHKKRPDVITFTSSSTAKNFLDLIGPELAHSRLLDGVQFASIGPVTTATLEELNFPVQIKAAEYTIPGLVKAIVEHFLNSSTS